jgi:hypothetical protein
VDFFGFLGENKFGVSLALGGTKFGTGNYVKQNLSSDLEEVGGQACIAGLIIRLIAEVVCLLQNHQASVERR